MDTLTLIHRLRAPLAGAALAAALAVAAPASAVTAATAVPGAAPGTVVFARGGDIVVRTPAGAERRLTRDRVPDATPVWSPDRRHIAFDRGNGDLAVMRADGGGLRRITTGPARDRLPAWSPDGRVLAFTSDRAGGEGEIHSIRRDGTGLRRITRTARWIDDTQPAFTPDGRHLLIASNRLGFFNHEVFRVRARDGGAPRRLTVWGTNADGAPGDDLMPSPSPDGERIAFVSDRAGAHTVWTMRADGRDVREIARHPGRTLIAPRHAPDGARVLYTVLPADGRDAGARLWTVAADGSDPRFLTRGSHGNW